MKTPPSLEGLVHMLKQDLKQYGITPNGDGTIQICDENGDWTLEHKALFDALDERVPGESEVALKERVNAKRVELGLPTL